MQMKILVVINLRKNKKEIKTEIITDGARSAGTLAEKYAKENNLRLTIVPAEWNKYGKRAEFIRVKN